MVKVNGFYIKELHTFKGMENVGMSGSLYKGKNLVCEFLDEGRGGNMILDNLSLNYLAEIKELLLKHKILPIEWKDDKGLVIDIFVSFIINAQEYVQTLKYHDKKETHTLCIFTEKVCYGIDRDFTEFAFSNKVENHPVDIVFFNNKNRILKVTL